ncbi:hypothetical protein [Bradyrhizobium sp. STM 3562]
MFLPDLHIGGQNLLISRCIGSPRKGGERFAPGHEALGKWKETNDD